MGSLGAPEIIIIAVVLLVLFGAKKLPELGSSVGKTITNFRRGMAEVEEEGKGEQARADEARAEQGGEV